jgi:hypothetical protein
MKPYLERTAAGRSWVEECKEKGGGETRKVLVVFFFVVFIVFLSLKDIALKNS